MFLRHLRVYLPSKRRHILIHSLVVVVCVSSRRVTIFKVVSNIILYSFLENVTCLQRIPFELIIQVSENAGYLLIN